MTERTVATCGVWTVEDFTEINSDGVAPGVHITDGRIEMFTIAEPAQLMICLAKYLGVKSWEAVPDDEAP